MQYVENENCAICLDPCTPENSVLLRQCEHIFHKHCVLQWMVRSDSTPTCPLCREAVVQIIDLYTTNAVPDERITQFQKSFEDEQLTSLLQNLEDESEHHYWEMFQQQIEQDEDEDNCLQIFEDFILYNPHPDSEITNKELLLNESEV